MELTEKQTQEKIKQYAPLIQKYDSPISVATRIAQLILESQLFTSDLALKSNNGFGIKVSKPWSGEGTEHLSGEVGGARVSNFRKYPTHEASIKDHAGFFTSTDFRASDAVYGLAIKATNYKDEATNLGPKFPGDKSSYAGDPKYGPKLIEIIERYNLTRYDKKESIKMPTILVIAGHGRNPNNGYFDPGATGFITKGEHRYMAENLFPAMKKHTPKDADIVYFSEYNVYSKGDLVALARKYGNDTIVVEMHYDATGNNIASGGHVIVHSDYEPDKIDLAIRDAIAKNVGLAYPVHKGHKGISGRSDLANPNRARNGGVNYRLPELGFGTNRKDATHMVDNVDQYAKDLVFALIGRTTEGTKPPQETITDPRVVALPEYREPTKSFKELKIGDVDQIREVMNFWYRPHLKDGYKPSVDVTNKEVTITDVKLLPEGISYSKRAYLLKEYSSWILEQDLVGPRAAWEEKEDDVQDKMQRYIVWDDKKFPIGNEIE